MKRSNHTIGRISEEIFYCVLVAKCKTIKNVVYILKCGLEVILITYAVYIITKTYGCKCVLYNIITHWHHNICRHGNDNFASGTKFTLATSMFKVEMQS